MKRLEGEVVLTVPAHTAWGMYRDDKFMSTININKLSLAEYIKGNGEPGSIRVLKLGPDVNDYVKESTERIDKVEEGRSVTYEVIGGCLKEMYEPYIVTFSFTPFTGHESVKCTAKWEAEFEPINPLVPMPERARDAALLFLQCFDSLPTV